MISSSKKRRFRSACSALLEAMEPRQLFAAFTVTNINDSGAGSLRQAMLDANATPNAGGADVINFNIASAGLQTIKLASALPAIREAVTIDGFTQPGASANTLLVGNDAIYLINLDGNAAGNDAAAFDVKVGSVTLRGLVVGGFDGE